jgi:uncharacterized protein YjbJ (UPF0337 family)
VPAENAAQEQTKQVMSRNMQRSASDYAAGHMFVVRGKVRQIIGHFFGEESLERDGRREALEGKAIVRLGYTRTHARRAVAAAHRRRARRALAMQLNKGAARRFSPKTS